MSVSPMVVVHEKANNTHLFIFHLPSFITFSFAKILVNFLLSSY